MKRFKLTILSFVGLLVTGACSDFLEEKSQDEVIPSTDVDGLQRDLVSVFKSGRI